MGGRRRSRAEIGRRGSDAWERSAVVAPGQDCGRGGEGARGRSIGRLRSLGRASGRRAGANVASIAALSFLFAYFPLVIFSFSVSCVLTALTPVALAAVGQGGLSPGFRPIGLPCVGSSPSDRRVSYPYSRASDPKRRRAESSPEQWLGGLGRGAKPAHGPVLVASRRGKVGPGCAGFVRRGAPWFGPVWPGLVRVGPGWPGLDWVGG